MPGTGDETVGDALWDALLARDPCALRAAPLYGDLLQPGSARGGFVLGRIAQSLDGRIATGNGRSRWISGDADLLHTHRLRALFDAIVVGAGTVSADDPQLTTRRCRGPSPVRVVIDTERRLGPHHLVFQGGPPTLLLCAEDAANPDRHAGRCGAAEVVRLPRNGAGLDLPSMVAALRNRGLHRIFVEGGGVTLSRFLAAGCLDRLHVTVAPLLLGDGIPAFTLPAIADPQQGLRLDWRVHRLGRDMLFDITLERRA